ncbi:hypothetical protein HK405_012134, partial [Cladochytrium tenue]
DRDVPRRSVPDAVRRRRGELYQRAPLRRRRIRRGPVAPARRHVQHGEPRGAAGRRPYVLRLRGASRAPLLKVPCRVVLLV